MIQKKKHKSLYEIFYKMKKYNLNIKQIFVNVENEPTNVTMNQIINLKILPISTRGWRLSGSVPPQIL